MRGIPYHLRPNKAADRFFFREMLLILAEEFRIRDWIYCGFGGPFLADFRALLEAFPEMKMWSIEREDHVHRSQRFHRPSKNVRLFPGEAQDFFASQMDESQSHIVWLDFNGLRRPDIETLQLALKVVPLPSIVRVTLRAEKQPGRRSEQNIRGWITNAVALAPEDFRIDDFSREKFPATLLNVLRTRIDEAIVQSSGTRYQLLHAFSYSDGTQMLSAAILLGNETHLQRAQECLKNWDLLASGWGAPIKLEMPLLSAKERLYLEGLLPSPQGTGKELARRLPHPVDSDLEASRRMLDSYRRLHRAYPVFARVTL